MRSPSDRTKVVLRRLPPSISQATLMEQIDADFAGRYNWVSFRPGMSSPKFQCYSRAYIDFQRPDDVIEFAEFFDGHVFVNEKGAQFKTFVEYAPLQRTPKHLAKKDGREGTILKDPEYVEFLEFVAKPVENLPSAEIQLERREAERTGAAKEPPIVTPLMDFVRQKRAAKSGSRRSLSNGKLNRRGARVSSASSNSSSSNRGSEKKKSSSAMYVLREAAKIASGKDKSTYILVPKRDDQSDKAITLITAGGADALEGDGVSGTSGTVKKKVVLLKGKEREIPNVTISEQQSVTIPLENPLALTVPKKIQRREGSGRIIRSILINKDARRSQLATGVQSEQKIRTSNLEKDRRPPRPPSSQFFLKDTSLVSDDKIVGSNKDRCVRNKDRPDRGGVWSPLRRSDGLYASDESLPSSASLPTQPSLESSEGSHGDIKIDLSSARIGDVKTSGGGRIGHHAMDNGSHRHIACHMPVQILKDGDGSSIMGEIRPSKRGGASSHGSYEKQVWVQKSSSGS